MHAAGRHFSQMVTERDIRYNIVLCFLIVFACVLTIAIFSLKNIMITCIMSFCLATIILSTLTFMNIFGYDLRQAENAQIILMIGISIDHIMYLALGYVHSDIQDRDQRIK